MSNSVAKETIHYDPKIVDKIPGLAQLKPEEVRREEAAARAQQIADTVKRMGAHGTGGRAGY